MRTSAYATAMVVAAYFALGVPASHAAVPVTPAPTTAIQCPNVLPAAPARPEPAASTSVAVTVPRLTFLVSTSAGWVVRTNTEAQPDPRDQFVVLASGGWSAASTAVRSLVLRTCG